MLTNVSYVFKGFNVRNERVVINARGLRQGRNAMLQAGVWRPTNVIVIRLHVMETLKGLTL